MSKAWMPFYPADYLADTGHLTTQEHGAYFLLILHYWSNGGLPSDENKLARIARMTPSEWTSVRDTIADFFDGNWQHFRIDAELATARQKYEARATAGSKGGRKAQAKLKQCSTNAQAGLDQPQSQPPITEPNGSDAVASVTPEAQLWKEGLPMLLALGVKESQARPMIGRWLRESNNDHLELLRLISVARQECPHGPIAWITASLKPRKDDGKPENLAATARRLAETGISFGPKPSLLPTGTEGGGAVVRMLPKGGRERS